MRYYTHENLTEYYLGRRARSYSTATVKSVDNADQKHHHPAQELWTHALLELPYYLQYWTAFQTDARLHITLAVMS